METSKEVKHKGVIDSINDDITRVVIQSVSACGSCHAKGMCGMSEMKEKTVEVKGRNNNYRVGDEVDVVMSLNTGFKALFYGYVIPLIIVLTSLILFLNITEKEGLSALLSLGFLLPYYLILYFNREQLKKKFSFTIREHNNY